MRTQKTINLNLLHTLAQRFKLKAEFLRFKLSQKSSGQDYFDAINKFIQQASTIKTYLWGYKGEFDDKADSLESIANCFEAFAASLVVFVEVSQSKECRIKRKEILQNLADLMGITSYYIQALEPLVDNDMSELEKVLKGLASELNQKLYWRVRSGFDPATFSTLIAKIEKWQNHLAAEDKQSSELNELLSLIEAKPETEAQWVIIADKATSLIDEGMKPSNKKLREILLPIFEEIPANEDYPSHFKSVMNEIDSFLARNEDVEHELIHVESSPEIELVRGSLKDRKLVLIGGQMRRAAKDQLVEAFELEDLIWSKSKERQSYKSFESDIRMPNVAAVCLAIRFCSHEYTKIKSFCDKASLPLIRLPAGYGANRVAREIIDQASERLKIVL